MFEIELSYVWIWLSQWKIDLSRKWKKNENHMDTSKTTLNINRIWSWTVFSVYLFKRNYFFWSDGYYVKWYCVKICGMSTLPVWKTDWKRKCLLNSNEMDRSLGWQLYTWEYSFKIYPVHNKCTCWRGFLVFQLLYTLYV